MPVHLPLIQRLWYRFIRWMLKVAYFVPHGGFRSVDAHLLPATGPVLVAPNHLSYLDPPAVAVGSKRQLRFISKAELFKGAFGMLLRSLGAFPIRRGESDMEAMRNSIAVLNSGQALLVFPEGTRGDGKQMLPMNRGIGMLAKRTNAIVVPCAVVGTERVWPREGPKGRAETIVAFGEGFRYSDVAIDASDHVNRQRFAAELERRILQLCTQHGLPLKSASSTENQATSARPEPEPATPDSPGA